MVVLYRLIGLLGPAVAGILGLVQLVMTIWMLIDAALSSADFYWFYIIFLFQPVGAWVYFFGVKVRDFTSRGPRLQRALPIEQLRYNLRSNPCVANKLALAHRLVDKNEAEEARELYQQVLKFYDVQREALFGLGRLQLQENKAADASATLERLLKLDASYRDYQAAEMAARAQWASGRRSEAIEAMDRLVRLHPRFTLMSTLARFLLESNRTEEARKLLNKALDDFRHSPRYIKRMNRSWPRQARALLKTAGRGQG